MASRKCLHTMSVVALRLPFLLTASRSCSSVQFSIAAVCAHPLSAEEEREGEGEERRGEDALLPSAGPCFFSSRWSAYTLAFAPLRSALRSCENLHLDLAGGRSVSGAGSALWEERRARGGERG